MTENGRSTADPAVIVGVDGSAGSDEALRWALGEARLRKAPLRVLHAWVDLHALVPALVGYPYVRRGSFEPHTADDATAGRQAAETVLERAIVELGELGDVEVERVIMEGSAAQVLIDAASEHDLLVVGSRGHGGFADLLLGSVSQQCAQHAGCPVVIVRAPGAVKEQ
jgi:nucleotide-binding universal stress UspA family protein